MSLSKPAKRGAPTAAQPAAKQPRVGTPDYTLAQPAAARGAAFEMRILRKGVGASLESRARITDTGSTTKAGKPGARYKHYERENLRRCVRIYLKQYRGGEKPPSYPDTAKRYNVPMSTIWEKVRLAQKQPAKMTVKVKGGAAKTKIVWTDRDEPLEWTDERLYKNAGKEATVPDNVMTLFVGILSAADHPHVLRQFTVDEASELLINLMDCHDAEYPDTWVEFGGPTEGWWRWFWKDHRAAHLSKGFARRLDEIRMTGQTEPAVRGWFSFVTDPLPDGEEASFGRTGEYGFFTPTGMYHYLLEEMPHKVPKTTAGEIDEPALRNLAWELVHDPRRQGNFDQKGHALGGKGNQEVIGTKGRRKERRDAADGRWLTLCPLIFGDGSLGFNAMVMQGKIPLDRTEQAAADAARAAAATTGTPPAANTTADLQPLDDRGTARSWGSVDVPVGETTLKSVIGHFTTSIGTSKSGYSNNVEHIAMFQEGIKQLVAREPWRLPFVLWLDNWSGHTCAEFRHWCRQTGIILVPFRAHTTTWACPLDNWGFGEYTQQFNAAIEEEKARGLRGGKLSFIAIMRAVAKAFGKAFLCDAAKAANANSFLSTIWSAKADASPHVTAGSALPALPPIFLDVETTVARINRGFRQLDKDGKGGSASSRKDEQRRDAQYLNDKAREKAASNKVIVEAFNRCANVPKGAKVERGADGQMLCWVCRQNEAAKKTKLSKFIHAGGQNTFRKLEQEDEETQREKAEEAEAKAARAAAAKEKKEKAADEKAEFEAALKVCVAEMKACLRLRGATSRDTKIERLTVVLADGAAAAKDVPGAHSQQKAALAKAKDELAKLEREVAAEAKAAAAAETKAAKEARAAARLAKLRAAKAARESVARKWTKRLLAAAKKSDAVAAVEVAKIQKAMFAAAKAEAEQAALEAAA
eukprot:COSAG04_NODE_1868_length_5348_cov_6.113524_2_plen_926_part_00